MHRKSLEVLKGLVVSMGLMKEVEERRVKAIFLCGRGECKGMDEECVFIYRHLGPFDVDKVGGLY